MQLLSPLKPLVLVPERTYMPGLSLLDQPCNVMQMLLVINDIA